MSNEKKEKRVFPVNADGDKYNPDTGRIYKKQSALSTRDPERDKIVIKKRKSNAGRKAFKNKKLEVTDEMREQVRVWASNKGTSVQTIARLLGTEVKTVNQKFTLELKEGKEMCVARVHAKIYEQAMSEKRDSLTAQSQKMFMQNVGDWKNTTQIMDSQHGGNTENIMKGMTETEKMQRWLSINKGIAAEHKEDNKKAKVDKVKPKNIEFN
jgi:L-rhamnose mutarotase